MLLLSQLPVIVPNVCAGFVFDTCFVIISHAEEERCCFTLIIFLLSCRCLCSVSYLSLTVGVVVTFPGLSYSDTLF